MRNIENKYINQLHEYIEDEDYCTESLDEDLLINKGNISQLIEDDICFDALSNMFKKSRCMFFY